MGNSDEINAEYARIQRTMMEEEPVMSNGNQPHSAIMAHVMHKRNQSKEMNMKRQSGVRTSQNQLPSIERKPRIGSSGQVSGKNTSIIEIEELSPTLNDKDPFMRVNKFKNAGISINVQQSKLTSGPRTNGINKPRYSHQENLNP